MLAHEPLNVWLLIQPLNLHFLQYGVWTDSRERLHWDPTSQDIGEIIANCASTHWADRKDGLMGLQMYFRDARLLVRPTFSSKFHH